MPVSAGNLKILPSDLHFRTETKPEKHKSAIKVLVGDYVISPNFGLQIKILDMAARAETSLLNASKDSIYIFRCALLQMATGKRLVPELLDACPVKTI